MSKLTEQLPIKISQDMKARIEKQRLERLKSGEDISISEIVRCLINKALDDTSLSYDEVCLLGSYISGQDSGTTWFYPLEGWEIVESSLLVKGLINREESGAYIASKDGMKVWDKLPNDQKNYLLVPLKRINMKTINSVKRIPMTNLERLSGIIEGMADGQNIENTKGMLRGVLKGLELEIQSFRSRLKNELDVE
jgi:hypothetical protein